jgi:hypothetical protein
LTPDKLIPSDGSDRSFFKIQWNGEPALAIEPASGDKGIAETYSYVAICNHLDRAGIPVPRVYEFNKDNGIIVVEYLGDKHLQTEILDLISQDKWGQVKRLYRKVLSLLAKMQVYGRLEFNQKWCCDSQNYDSKLAREREAFYFLSCFVEDFMGYSKTPELENELSELALLIDFIDNKDFFLHGDFQSRNILLQNEALRIIDFQGGRLGPLAYDAASLILDPYVALPENMWDELLQFYLDELNALNIVLDRDFFKQEFYLLALFRTMQALGAYSYLYIKKGKPFFKPYISPALSNLRTLLTRKDFERLHNLKLLIGSKLYHSA